MVFKIREVRKNGINRRSCALSVINFVDWSFVVQTNFLNASKLKAVVFLNGGCVCRVLKFKTYCFLNQKTLLLKVGLLEIILTFLSKINCKMLNKVW